MCIDILCPAHNVWVDLSHSDSHVFLTLLTSQTTHDRHYSLAKSGSDWTTNDLRAYNVNVVNEDIATFFGMDHLPLPPVRQAILTNLDYPANGLPDREDRLFFDYMHYAMLTPPGERSRLWMILLPIFLACFATMSPIASYASVKTSHFSHVGVRCTRRRMSA